MCHVRFDLYDVEQWNLLTEQVVERYGTAVLNQEFCLNSIPQERRSLIQAFQAEFRKRTKEGNKER
jgi:hypothetical protein